MHLLWKSLQALFAALFVFAAALQYNDPDPIRWAAIYLAAAVPCGLAMMGRRSGAWPAILGGISLVWAVTYLVRGVPSVSPWHMFDEWEMKNQQVVETRELFGLLIVATWMLVLVIGAWIARRHVNAAGTAAGAPASVRPTPDTR